MRIRYLIAILLVLIPIATAEDYIPPNKTDVDLVLNGSYTPETKNSVDLVIGLTIKPPTPPAPNTTGMGAAITPIEASVLMTERMNDCDGEWIDGICYPYERTDIKTASMGQIVFSIFALLVMALIANMILNLIKVTKKLILKKFKKEEY